MTSISLTARAMRRHANKLEQIKRQNKKDEVKTVESELKRKKDEKLKNMEFMANERNI